MSTAARDIPWLLLYQPAPRLSLGLIRTVAVGVVFSVILLARVLFSAEFSPGALAAELLAGLTVSVSLWGAHAVWRHTIQPLLHGRGTTLQALSRMPFWAMAGGMGYTVAMLISASARIFPVNDRPVERLLLSGALWFGGIQLLWESVNYFVQRPGHDR